MGMIPAQVVTIINTATEALGLLAILAGILVGLGLTGGMLTGPSQVYGFGHVNLSFTVWGLTLLIPLIILVSLGEVISLQARRRGYRLRGYCERSNPQRNTPD